jgi:pSer/pThr/pTyr-binding forkhead associated (FHA) protein
MEKVASTGGRAHLLVLNGSSQGLRFPVEGDVRIGRGSKCDLRLRDAGISSEHARLFCQDGQFFIEDLGSTCGTFVNGNDVPDAQDHRADVDREDSGGRSHGGVVRDQDEIQIAVITLRFLASTTSPDNTSLDSQFGTKR